MKLIERINYHYGKRRPLRRGYVYVRPVTELDQFVGNLGHKSVTAAKNITLLYAGALAQEFSKSLTNKAVKKVASNNNVNTKSNNTTGYQNQYQSYQQQQASNNFFSNSGGYSSRNYESLNSNVPW